MSYFFFLHSFCARKEASLQSYLAVMRFLGNRGTSFDSAVKPGLAFSEIRGFHKDVYAACLQPLNLRASPHINVSRCQDGNTAVGRRKRRRGRTTAIKAAQRAFSPERGPLPGPVTAWCEVVKTVKVLGLPPQSPKGPRFPVCGNKTPDDGRREDMILPAAV